LGTMFRNIGYHIAASFFGWTCQFVFVYYGLFYVVTRPGKLNIFWYHKQMIPAQTMAFACASSAATIPTSLACIKSTGIVPDAIAGFCIPLGATVNMDGGAVYFVTACVWMAHLNGITVTAANYFLLIVCATLGAIGTAPVPSASLVLIITAYNTVFNTTGIPDGFGYILAIDWFMDRCRTVLNVTGDLVVSAATAINRPIEDAIKAFDEEESPGTLEKDVGSDGSPSNSNVAETVPEKSLNAE
jgi:Na+/H+-dicarboxylate symporter